MVAQGEGDVFEQVCCAGSGLQWFVGVMFVKYPYCDPSWSRVAFVRMLRMVALFARGGRHSVPSFRCRSNVSLTQHMHPRSVWSHPRAWSVVWPETRAASRDAGPGMHEAGAMVDRSFRLAARARSPRDDHQPGPVPSGCSPSEIVQHAHFV